MRIMHDMSSIILYFPEAVVVPQSGLCGSKGMDARAREGRASPMRRRASVGVSVRAQIDFMRARGMSNTGIRRTLGLSEWEAVNAGIIPSRIEADRKDRTPVANAARIGVRENGSRYTPSTGRGGPQMVAVLAAVAQAGKVSQGEIVGASQGRRLTPLRQLTMYLLRELCEGASLPAIGHFLARDHTTVHYGCRKAKKRLLSDPDFRLLHDDVRASLAQHAATADG